MGVSPSPRAARIRPGKPIENAYVESFKGKFRDERLNEHWFLSIAEAQQIIEAWRADYNTVRPHRSLGQLTPAAYAAAACAGPAAGWGGLLGGCSGHARTAYEIGRTLINRSGFGGPVTVARRGRNGACPLPAEPGLGRVREMFETVARVR